MADNIYVKPELVEVKKYADITLVTGAPGGAYTYKAAKKIGVIKNLDLEKTIET